MEARKYPTYHYLKFIWDKKFWVIGITILFMILAAAFSYMQGKKPTYTTTATIFTGNANNDQLSKTELIAKDSEYEKIMKDNGLPGAMKVDIPDTMVITISASAQNKAKVESAVKEVANTYYSNLLTHFTEQKNTRKQIEDLLDDSAVFTKEKIEVINDQTALGLHDYIDNKIELVKMEEPEIKKVSTVASSNNLKRNVVLAGALGFQFMLILLVFWKYIIDARRFNS